MPKNYDTRVREGITTPSSPPPFSFSFTPHFFYFHRSIAAHGWPTMTHVMSEGMLGFCYCIFLFNNNVFILDLLLIVIYYLFFQVLF